MTRSSTKLPAVSWTKPPVAPDQLLGRSFAGRMVVPDRSGALWLPEDGSTLIVADLHLEKGSSFARRGQLLPPYDTAATFTALEHVVARLEPRRLIALGDSFHDEGAAARISADDRARIERLASVVELIWITGNHDPAPISGIPGRFMAELALDARCRLLHVPTPALERGICEIAGHFHPVAAIRQRGRRIAARCFVRDDQRMILPAFGAYTGGLNVRDKAIAGLFGDDFTACLIGSASVHAIPARLLRR